MMYAADEFYDDETTSGSFDLRCVACDGPIDDYDHSDSVCDDCSAWNMEQRIAMSYAAVESDR